MSTPATAEWRTINDAAGKPLYEQYGPAIQKSQTDSREYRYIRLPNRLEALLVSDPETDKSAAALDVNVGHLTDPDDVPGCAHFCEHLLFMGTEEFPSENEYSQFISSHGGATNAYTSAYNTNYYFSVAHTSLDGALARFSAFFKTPLFTASCTERELNAVDSEHKKNLQNDTWRMFQLSKFLSRADHQWRKFGSGNKESLLSAGKALEATMPPMEIEVKEKGQASLAIPNGNAMDVDGILAQDPSTPVSGAVSGTSSPGLPSDGGVAGRETRRRLVEWWEKQYCASRMKLVVLGKESLDELTAQATKHFAAVPDRNLPPPLLFEEKPFGPEHEGIIAYSKTIMDFKALEVVWAIPWQAPFHEYKPGNFVSHFVGHEGPGSLHSYLKNKGWITYLSAGPSTGAPGFDFFKVTIVLTQDGLENHLEVIRALYSYLSLLRSSTGPDLKDAQDEMVKLSHIFFRFKEKASSASSYVSRLAERSSNPYPRSKVLSASTVVEKWDESLIREILETHLTPQKARVMVMAREGWDKVQMAGQESKGPPAVWQKEAWYETEFTVSRTPEEIIKETQGPNTIKELALPRKNQFIPDDLAVEQKAVEVSSTRPLRIRDTPLSTLWYKKDDQFWVPKANVNILIVSPLTAVTPKHNVATRIFVDLVRDALTEYAYDADLAGLVYEVDIQGDGITVTMGGYNDKLVVLLKVVLEKIKNLVVREDRFAVMKEQLRQEYENLSMEQPYHLSDYYAKYLLSPSSWTPEEKLTELLALQVDDIRHHIPEFLGRAFLRTLVHGNLAKNDANEIVQMAEKTINARPLTPAELIAERSLILLPNSNSILEMPVPNKNDVNSSITYYAHVGDIADARTRAVLGLFAHIASEPAFNQLRTVEQLGYIVGASNWGSNGSIGWRLVVQSEKDPIYLENRVDAFLLDVLKPLLETMPTDIFEQKRKSLIQKKLEKFKNLGDETNTFWTSITTGYHDFTRRTSDAENLRDITRQDVLDLFMKYICPTSNSRSKLSVLFRSQMAPSRRFSVPASVALLGALKSRGVHVEEEMYNKLSEAEPAVSAVKSFWTNHFKSLQDLDAATAQELLSLIDRLSKEYPSPKDETEQEGKLQGSYRFIHDMAAFKASLAVSPAATPIEEYRDFDPRL